MTIVRDEKKFIKKNNGCFEKSLLLDVLRDYVFFVGNTFDIMSTQAVLGSKEIKI